MSRVRRHYSREFKLKALQLVETSGKALVDLERELGLSDGCLYQWQREFGQNGGSLSPGNGHGAGEAQADQDPIPGKNGSAAQQPEATPAARRRMEIAERVRIARQRKRLTQSDLARLLQCSRKRVNDVERGLSTLSAVEIDVLAEQLGFPHEFFYRRDT